MTIIDMSTEIFSKQSFELFTNGRSKLETIRTILIDQLKKILHYQSQAACKINLVVKKKCIAFHVFFKKRLSKENESRHCAIRCFLRITIFKVCRYKFIQQNSDYL